MGFQVALRQAPLGRCKELVRKAERGPSSKKNWDSGGLYLLSYEIYMFPTILRKSKRLQKCLLGVQSVKDWASHDCLAVFITDGGSLYSCFGWLRFFFELLPNHNF